MKWLFLNKNAYCFHITISCFSGLSLFLAFCSILIHNFLVLIHLLILKLLMIQLHITARFMRQFQLPLGKMRPVFAFNTKQYCLKIWLFRATCILVGVPKIFIGNYGKSVFKLYRGPWFILFLSCRIFQGHSIMLCNARHIRI